MKLSDFECCICKKTIAYSAVDPVDLKITLNEDFEKETGQFQLLYAHFQCLKQILHKDVQTYLVGEDR